MSHDNFRRLNYHTNIGQYVHIVPTTMYYCMFIRVEFKYDRTIRFEEN